MSLARLVVHLQANYSNLTSGLKVAANETVRTAQQITQSIRSITPDTITTLSVKADEAAAYMENMAAAADLVEHSVSSAAFTAGVAASTFQKMSTTATMVGNAFTVLDRSTSVATGGLQTAASVAHRTAPALNVAASASGSLSRSLLLVSSGARVFGSWMTTAGSLTRGLATGISHIAHSMHAAMIVTGLLSTAFSMLMVPVKLIGSAAAFVFTGMLWALKTVLLPLKLLWNGFVVAAQAVWAIVKPLASVGLAVAKVWFVFNGWIASIRIIASWLGMLPPKLRLLVGGLLALGLAGRAGALAMRAFSMAVGAVAFVAKVAVNGVRLLLLPLQLITNPAAAAATAMELLTATLSFVGRMALRAGAAFMGLAGSIVKIARTGISTAISAFKSLGTAIFSAAKNAVVFGAGAAVWIGVKLAAAAETSRVVFGTMLHDMEQGKALLDALQSSKVAPFFDAKAIQEAGRDLLKAKVPVDQITGRLEQLGSIALATKTPIEDLSRIYRQGMARGAFQTDLVNQMAERGIDIYAALTHVTGLSGQALADAMSAGKIGATEMNAAIDHMTLNHGIYAGVVDNIAQTTAGMWSASLQNISMALQTMFGVALDGNNGLLASWVSITEQIKQRAASIGPVIMQLTNVITGAFSSLNQAVSMTLTMLFGETQTTFSSMLGSTMEWVTKFRWYFSNLVPITQFVWMSIGLLALSAFNDISYWITDKIPAYLTWFADNWKAVFRDIAVGTMTVFSNLAGNIKNAMTVIWEFIKSGGTSGLQFTWTPLLDGFKATVAELPDVPDRAMTALEQGMEEQIQLIGTDLADSFDSMMTEANNSMAAAAAVQPPIQLQSTAVGGTDTVDAAGDSGIKGGGQQDNSPLLKGTREAQAAIYAAIAQAQGQKDKLQQQQLKETQKLNASNQRIAETLANAPQIAVVESLA